MNTRLGGIRSYYPANIPISVIGDMGSRGEETKEVMAMSRPKEEAEEGDGLKLKAEMSLLNGCGVIVGCIIFFVAFFGCCGAIKENHCMTLTFAILLGIIFLMEVGAGIAAYKLKHQVMSSHCSCDYFH